MTDSIPPDNVPLKGGFCISLKRCSSCPDPEENKWHPATPEYFHRDKSSKDGLRSRCKECHKAYAKGYYSRPEVREHKSALAKAYSQRPEVQEHLQIYQQDYYNRPEVREHRRVVRKTYNSRPDVQEHRRVYGKEYQSRPHVHSRRRAWKKDYSRRSDIHEHQQAYGRDYYNRPGIREHRSALGKAYRSRPEVHEQGRVRVIHRRSRKKAVPGTHTSAQIAEQLKRQHYCCYYAACGFSKFPRVQGKYVYHIEHTFPISRVVGTGIPANDIGYLVLSCGTCNDSKGSKFPWEWFEGGRLL